MSDANRRKNRMCRNIIIISFLFMLTSLPTASIQGKTIKYLLSFSLGQLIVTLCNSLTFTYQASNFLMHYLVNRKFATAVKVLFFGVENISQLENTGLTLQNLSLEAQKSRKGSKRSQIAASKRSQIAHR